MGTQSAHAVSNASQLAEGEGGARRIIYSISFVSLGIFVKSFFFGDGRLHRCWYWGFDHYFDRLNYCMGHSGS